MENIKTVWDFVTNYYPDYSSSDEIAENDDLHKICDNEINGYAEEMYNEKIGDLKIFWGDTLSDEELHEEAIKHFLYLKNESDANVFSEAIEGFIENQKFDYKIEDLKTYIDKDNHSIKVCLNTNVDITEFEKRITGLVA